MKFLIVNGHIVVKEEARLSSFLWNDPILISQKVWFGFGGIPLLQENIANLEEQLNSFGADLPSLFKNTRELFRLCKRLLNKNKFYRSGHLLFLFSISAGLVNFLISAENYSGFSFPLNEQGLLVNISPINKCIDQPYHKLKCHNTLFWQAIRNELRETSFQNSIICNRQNFVSEAVAANLFFIKDGVLITPAPESGCYEDIFRKIMLELATKMKIKILESTEIKPSLLFEMDEAFMLSEAGGMEWILGIENKRFVRSVLIELHEKINLYLKEKVKNLQGSQG